MTITHTPAFTSFEGNRLLSSGTLCDVAVGVKRAQDIGAVGTILIFDDSTGRSIDVDLRGSEEDIARRLGMESDSADLPKGRGRPKLGVVAREVTLLPRHWEWLAAQPGGASVTLRKLVEEARRAEGGTLSTKKKQERAYNFMSAIAGDAPGFEEASRALFANDRAKFTEIIAVWPKDIRDHLILLAFGEHM